MEEMRAVSVTPGVSGSARLTVHPRPVPAAGEALVRVLATGVCGTDREILAGHTGTAPTGAERLIIGHECLGEVVTGDAEGTFPPGTLVAPMVRRPDGCPACRAGRWDLCQWGNYTERGIRGAHGFMAEWYTESPDYLVPLPPELRAAGMLVEPAAVVAKALSEVTQVRSRIPWPATRALVLGGGSIGLLATLLLRHQGLEVHTLDLAAADSLKARLVEASGARYVAGRGVPVNEVAEQAGNLDIVVEATGAPGMAFAAMEATGIGGVAVLLGVPGAAAPREVDAAWLTRQLVERNAAVVGSINAARLHFDAALTGLLAVQRRWPGVLERMITGRYPLAQFEDAIRGGSDTVKSVVEP